MDLQVGCQSVLCGFASWLSECTVWICKLVVRVYCVDLQVGCQSVLCGFASWLSECTAQDDKYPVTYAW